MSALRNCSLLSVIIQYSEYFCISRCDSVQWCRVSYPSGRRVSCLAHVSYVARKTVAGLKLVCFFFDLSYDHNLKNQRSYAKIWDVMRKLISYYLRWCHVLRLRCYCHILKPGNRRSLVGTYRSKNAFLKHLQTTLLKISIHNPCNSLLTAICWQQTSTSIAFFAWGKGAGCNELQ